jgi:hypothetical protein
VRWKAGFVCDVTMLKHMVKSDVRSSISEWIIILPWCCFLFFLNLFHVHFFVKGNMLISKDTNYIQLLQQRNALLAVRMHTTTKKEK